MRKVMGGGGGSETDLQYWKIKAKLLMKKQM
jgi:hypothetical protein